MTACTIRVMRGRKKMKKFVGIIVATVLAFSLVGCGPVDSAIQNIASPDPIPAARVVW
jgi:hypothetical protein